MPSDRPTRFPHFGDLPEPFRRAVFQEAWRDRAAWMAPDGRGRFVRCRRSELRLVSREACAAVETLVTHMGFSGQDFPLSDSELEYAPNDDFEYCPGSAGALELEAFLAAAGGGRFPTLRKISLVTTILEEAETAVLLAGQWPRLEELDFVGVGTTPTVADEITEAAASKFPALRQLSITGTASWEFALGDYALSDWHVRALVEQAWPHLEILDLDGNEIYVAGAEALASATAAGKLPALRELRLTDNFIEDGGICALAAASWPRLEVLHCGRNRSVDEEHVVRALVAAGRKHFPRLQELKLDLGEGDDGQRRRDLLAAAWPGAQIINAPF